MSLIASNDPRTSDGKPIVVEAKYPGNVDPYFAGTGDLGGVRGGGPLFAISWASAPVAPDDKALEFQFQDWVYVSAGAVRYRNAGVGDSVSFKVYAPASTVVANPGAGNVNLVPLGPGMDLIVPAVGGSHDLVTGVPVPAGENADGVPTGFWEWNDPDTGSGVLSPVPTQTGRFNLYAFPIDMVRWVAKLPLLGSGFELLAADTKARKILPQWVWRCDAHNESLAQLDVTWSLNLARKKTTP